MDCISRWLQQNSRCPITKEPLAVEDLRKPSAALQAFVDDAIVHCTLCSAALRHAEWPAHFAGHSNAVSSASSSPATSDSDARGHKVSSKGCDERDPTVPSLTIAATDFCFLLLYPCFFQTKITARSQASAEPSTPEKPTAHSAMGDWTPVATPLALPPGVRSVWVPANGAAPAAQGAYGPLPMAAMSGSVTSLSDDMEAGSGQDDYLPGLTYEYFAGTFDNLPHFEELARPTQSGITPNCSLKALMEAQVITCTSSNGKLGRRAQSGAKYKTDGRNACHVF